MKDSIYLFPSILKPNQDKQKYSMNAPFFWLKMFKKATKQNQPNQQKVFTKSV